MQCRRILRDGLRLGERGTDWPQNIPARRVRLMDRRELWRRLKAGPNNVRFADAEQLLLLSGWNLERQRGSHVFYRKGERRISVPFRRGTMLPVYVWLLLDLTKEEGDD